MQVFATSRRADGSWANWARLPDRTQVGDAVRIAIAETRADLNNGGPDISYRLLHLLVLTGGGGVHHALSTSRGTDGWGDPGSWTALSNVLDSGAAGPVQNPVDIAASGEMDLEDWDDEPGKIHVVLCCADMSTRHCIRVLDGGWTRFHVPPGDPGDTRHVAWHGNSLYAGRRHGSVRVLHRERVTGAWWSSSSPRHNLVAVPSNRLVGLGGVSGNWSPPHGDGRYGSHALAAGHNGVLYHTLGSTDWGATFWSPWRSVLDHGAAGGAGSQFEGQVSHVSCAPVGEYLHVCVVNDRGHLLHCVRKHDSGLWSPLRLIPGAAGLPPIRHAACATPGYGTLTVFALCEG